MTLLDDIHTNHIAAAKWIMENDGDCILVFVLYKDDDPAGGAVINSMGMEAHLGKNGYLEIMRRMVLSTGVVRYGFMTRIWMLHETVPDRGAAAKLIKHALPPSGRLSDRPGSFEVLWVASCEPGASRQSYIPIQRTNESLSGFGTPVDMGEYQQFGNFQNYFDEKRNPAN